MSRHFHRTNQHAIYALVEQFKDRCLIEDGSMFSGEQLWTADGFAELVTWFVDNPDESQSGFFQKFEKQLGPAAPATKKLASELFWLMQLCPSNVGVKSKQEAVRSIWSWSGEALPTKHPCLDSEILDGIGSGGMGYNTNRWRELRYAILMFSSFKQLVPEARRDLISNHSSFADWLHTVPDDAARQFRSMLLHLLDPDSYERIFSRGDRREILMAFTGMTKAAWKKLTNVEIDNTLLEIRQKIADELGTPDFDFYEGQIRDRWKPRKGDIDLKALEEYKQAFLNAFPDDRTFSSPAYLQAERNYKLEIGERFSQINLTGAPLEVTDALLKLLTQPMSNGQPQNLVNWRQFDGLPAMTDLQKQSFSAAVIDLVNGEDELQPRADRFMAYLTSLYEDLGKKQFPSKIRGITSFFLFASDPAKFPFIKTTEIRKSMNELVGQQLSNDADQFEQVCTFLEQLKAALLTDNWSPRDMVDLQSFIWVKMNAQSDNSNSIAFQAEEYLEGRYGYRKSPTKYIAAFQSPSGKQLALERTRSGISIWLTEYSETLEGIQLLRTYSPDEPRNSNLKSQAPDLSPGNQAALVGVTSIDALEKLCDMYDDIQVKESGVKPMMANSTLPTNRILYGPPGTGKTYATVELALQILDSDFFASHSHNRESLKQRYDELKAEGRIEFVTFHQSFAYEDFVEGLRANSEGNAGVSYDIEDGVFKRLCDHCRSSSTNTLDDAMESFCEDITEAPKLLRTFRGKEFQIQYKGGKTFTFKPLASATDYSGYTLSIPRIKDLYQGRPDNEIYNVSYAKAVLNELRENYGLEAPGETTESVVGPHVIIIDEINRGNIAKIFGELITLIEPSKRAGAPEALNVTLPYSKRKFSVPPNLYIIGTMNTADRSLVQVDTALRRRFQFIEMMPDLSLLSGIHVEGVDVSQMLKTINDRIELLYDREHTLGHSFFLPLKGEPALEKLSQIMTLEVFPLLEEYFFEDWGRIRQVLGDSLKQQRDLQFFMEKHSDSDISRLLGSDVPGTLSSQFERNPDALNNPAAYIGIYATAA